MQSEKEISSPWKSRIFVLVFVAVLALIVAGFMWIVQNAKATLPQTSEIISMEEVAKQIESGSVDSILLQGDQDVFLYLPGHPRPLYARLALGSTFTTTLEGLGVPAGELPPVTVEKD
ncbi:MAG: hypothetical protein WBO46_11680 [Caldilineaceae bacterium]